MDTLCTELVVRVVEYACVGDFGQTARRIGLVSRYFRAVAEPFEIRTIEVSGLRQLRGAVARLDSAGKSTQPNGSRSKDVEVQHLFISELTKKHALAAETSKYYDLPFHFWREEGRMMVGPYDRKYSENFWTLATALVKRASHSLKTLCMLSSRNWIAPGSTRLHEVPLPRVLGALYCAAFPNLESLTVDHDAADESYCFDFGREFGYYLAPSLQRLHVTSRIWNVVYVSPYTVSLITHPLLGSVDVLFPELTHLTVKLSPMIRLGEAMKAVLGDHWRKFSHSRTLPGKLQSVLLQPFMPFLDSDYSQADMTQRHVEFAAAINELNIDGVQMGSVVPWAPEVGEGRYHTLLEGWKEHCSMFLV